MNTWVHESQRSSKRATRRYYSFPALFEVNLANNKEMKRRMKKNKKMDKSVPRISAHSSSPLCTIV